MPRLFVSYRREDTSGHVGRLQEGLRKELGSKNVFVDVDSINPGVDFERAIRAAVNGSDYVLAVIGKDWLVATDPQGQRRLDDPHDYVRLELIYALESKAKVIPVLVRDAKMPREEELPEPLRILSNSNASNSAMQGGMRISRISSPTSADRRCGGGPEET